MRTRFGLVACSIVVTLACGSTGGSPKGSAGSGGSSVGGADAGASGGASGSATGGGAAGATGGGGAAGATGAGGAGGMLSGNPITFGTCDAFTPCGGDETGTWNYTGACADSSALVDTIKSACATATTDLHGVVSGTLSFIGGIVQRSGSYTVVLTVNFPSACVIGGCAVLQAAIAGQIPGSKCTNGAQGSCDCTGSVSGGGIATQTYTATGNTITLADGRTFDYCITGDGFVYQETTQNADPATYSLTRQ